MNKIKWTILTFAILFSIGSAFATRPKALFSGLYYYTGSGYAPAQTLGVNYVCESSPNVCTYTYSNGVYTPYNTQATYTPLGVATPPAETKPTTEKK
jgi:hypothetical protein